MVWAEAFGASTMDVGQFHRELRVPPGSAGMQPADFTIFCRVWVRMGRTPALVPVAVETAPSTLQCLTTGGSNSMIRVFFSYSHRDEGIRDELEVHLSMLRRDGVIETWHDREIEAGADFGREIGDQLERADVVLLLVSAHFLASDYCYGVEMKRALERHERSEARVIPIIVDPCDWKHAPFGHLLATPRDGKPISKFSNRHDAYLDIVTSIRKVVASIAGTEDAPASAGASGEPVVAATAPRSSNLRIKKPLSDHDRDVFRDESFEYIANYFENSLGELKRRNPHLEARFRRDNANEFTAAIYAGGQKTSGCRVRLNSDFGGDITYSIGDSGSPGSFNESLTVSHDGYTPSLRPLGLASFGSQSERELSQEGAAEYFWEIFMRPMQA